MIVVHQRWTDALPATGLSGQVVEALCVVPEGPHFKLFSGYYDPNQGQSLADAYWHDRGHQGHMPGMLVDALNMISHWPEAADLVTYGREILAACETTYKACKHLDPHLPDHLRLPEQTPFSA